MKRRILFLILSLSCMTVKAEHSYTLWETLDSDKDYHYTANSHITLSDGFLAQPKDGHEVLLDIDSYGVFPPTSGVTGGTPLNNAGGVVGSLEGHVDVSLSGGAVYAIPIELPTGLGGMKPQLSICYNSQSRNGLLGWGWSVSGLSSITRTGGTLYHDGYVSAVNYSNDRFCLDGNRILKVSSGSYGGDGTSYRTEQDQMNKIVSYHESGINGPAFFKVWTADGNLLYYGSTEDARAFIDQQNHVGEWLLSRVEDRNGNSIEYHYIIEPDSYRIDEIVYSGNSNASISPSFTVRFHYSTRDDVEISMVGHLICRMDQKLDDIEVYNGTSSLYSYQFIYQKPNPKNGLPYHLLTQINFHAGQEHFNPTQIQWNSNNYNTISGSDLKYPVTTNGITDAFNNAVKFSGDFNGDGYADVVALQPNEAGYYSTANLFVNRGLDDGLMFDFVQSFNLSPNISWIQVVDFNGDGLDDLLFSNRIRNVFPFPDQIEAEIYLCRMLSSGGFGFDKQVTPLCFISSNATDAHLVGDFLGDGRKSILIQTVARNGKSLEESQLIYYDEFTGEVQLHQFPETLNDTRLFAADYDGDGITEILYKKTNGNTAVVKLTKSSDTYHYNEIHNETLEDWSDCFPGDFNGDGLTDVLFYSQDDAQPWRIHLSMGSRIDRDGYPLPANFPYSSPGDYLFSLDQPNHTNQYIKIGDFDGNGCSDLSLYKDNLFYVFYGPLKESGDEVPFTNCQKINAKAFGLYDNMNVCLDNFLGQERLSFLGNTTLSRLPSMRSRHEVKKITDGMGRKTEFAYDYLAPCPNNPSDDDFYKLSGTGLDHFYNTYCIAVPMRGLKKVTTYNINNKPVETRCFYEDALLHKNGKGFLGFSKIRQDDYCDHQLQKKTQKQFDVEYTDNIIHLTLAQEVVFDPNGHLMARSFYNNRLYSHTGNDKVFILVADKSIEEFDINQPEQLIKKEIINTSVAKNCNQLHQYDNVISITEQTKGTTSHSGICLASACEFQEITQTTYLPDNYSSWMINRPLTITHRFHREGNYEDVCHQQCFTYSDNKPYQVESFLELPNDGSNPQDRLVKKTQLEYDLTGNITSKTLSTPNDTVTPRQERFEYSKDYACRLLTKYTDASGGETCYEYDPVYNHPTLVIDNTGLKTRYEQDPLGITCMAYYPDGTQSCKALRWGSNYYYQWEKKSGQETKTSIYAFSGEPIGERNYDIQGELVLSNIEYDHLGRILKKTLPHGIDKDAQFIQYQYDSHNRLDRIDHTDGSYETLQHNADSESSTFYATNGDTQSESKTFNVMGWVVRSTDTEGNSIVYDYQADGKPLSAQVEGHDETRIEMTYDGLGNRNSLNDPDYGLTTCEYNAFNEIVRQVSPKQDETLFRHDFLGRTVERIETNHSTGYQEVTQWHYGTEEGLKGILTSIVSPRQTIQYEYDTLLRLTHTTETLEASDYHTYYSYDPASRIANIRHPSDYTVNYSYTSEGFLRTITDADSTLLWKNLETNAFMQPTKILTGNGFTTHNKFDGQTNRLISIQTSTEGNLVQNHTYEYDDFANMTQRNDLKNGFKEQFLYDPLNRLTQIETEQGTFQFDYDPLGRMTRKTSPDGVVFADANYSGLKPHALKTAAAPHDVFPQERLDIEYNVSNKVVSISEGDKNILFDYGYDHQRVTMKENLDGNTRTKTYVGACEYIKAPEGNSVWTFISGPSGVFAVAETIQGQTKLHYIHKDHLGSWTIITDEKGCLEQERQFDAWGSCQDPDLLMFDRGYTGHEHLKGVNLINMNGRLYDPVTSSMLSPDNNIQMPDFAQNFNRYSYCLNNPLTYADPDGNTFVESALIFYFLYCTDFGYEYQKYTSPLAFHLDLHLSSQQFGIGFDASFGIPKDCIISYRTHAGATLYGSFYDGSFSGMEFRLGAEWCAGGLLGYSGTSFYQRKLPQTTNSIILGSYYCNIIYENDYMFNLGKYIPCIPTADNGDRYRTAAARFRLGPLFIGVNIFTGDPGVDHDIRRTFNDPERQGRETYTISANGDDPDSYRAGVVYVGIGPFKIGANSEKIRDFVQNRFAHDWLCKKDSPYFKVLDRPGNFYFYFGTETGSTLW